MNISCTACPAKYALSDEKVRGKKVKITCKHCGAAIIVDGTKIDAAAPAPEAPAKTSQPAAPTASLPSAPAAPPAAAPDPPPAPAPELRFDIAYPDERQETLRLSEIVEKYAAGALRDDAFLWREGMADWKAPFDIPEIASALTAKGLKKRAPEAPVFGVTGFLDDEATTMYKPGDFPAEAFAAAPAEWREPGKEPPSSPHAAFDLRAPAALPFEAPEPAASPAAITTKPPAITSAEPAAPPEAVKPVAARRSPAAKAGADLFGDLANAGSEQDESLGTETADPKDAGSPKLTGARNESSVLFSLDALVKQEKKPAGKAKPEPENAAALLLGSDSAPSSIANVGTGSFASAFAAPDFTAPVTAPPQPIVDASAAVPFSAEAPPKKRGVGIYVAIVALLGLGGAAVALGLPAKLGMIQAEPSASPAASTTSAPSAPTPTAAETTAAPTAPSAEASAATSAPATSASASPALSVAAVAGAPRPAAAPASAAGKPDPATASSKASETKPEKPAEEAAAPSDTPPFDKNAAIAALSAAAGNAQTCKTPDGPSGSGKVSITFMPSGRATNTQVSGDLAGTAVGGCVARLFRAAKVPPFSGDPVTVSKSFTVQ